MFNFLLKPRNSLARAITVLLSFAGTERVKRESRVWYNEVPDETPPLKPTKRRLKRGVVFGMGLIHMEIQPTPVSIP